MPSRPDLRARPLMPLGRPSLPFTLFLILLVVLWVGGGASRADAAGQIVVRVAAVVLGVIALLFSNRRAKPPKAPALLLAAMFGLVLLHLLPLPPAWWQALPGRGLFADAAVVAALPGQPWRPLSLVPDSTINAAISLIVPAVALALISLLNRAELARIPGALLTMMAASMLLGLFQFTGARFNNPLINDTPGMVSSSFANRNHLALFLACGCLLAPIWAVLDGRKPGWPMPATLALLLLFPLIILATGSRAGLVLAPVAIALGLGLTARRFRKQFRRAPRWVGFALLAGVVALLALVVSVSVAADRAVSIERVFAQDAEQDMRGKALPVLLEMINAYFPAGAGVGSFDPAYRVHEPADLLQPNYLNHAHNDFIEIVLDGGLPGLLLLLAGLVWWLWATVRGWRLRSDLALAGSAVILLVLIASAFDYPARTPTIMVLLVIAAAWLSIGSSGEGDDALPAPDQHL